jgi:hypothetical protein
LRTIPAVTASSSSSMYVSDSRTRRTICAK